MLEHILEALQYGVVRTKWDARNKVDIPESALRQIKDICLPFPAGYNIAYICYKLTNNVVASLLHVDSYAEPKLAEHGQSGRPFHDLDFIKGKFAEFNARAQIERGPYQKIHQRMTEAMDKVAGNASDAKANAEYQEVLPIFTSAKEIFLQQTAHVRKYVDTHPTRAGKQVVILASDSYDSKPEFRKFPGRLGGALDKAQYALEVAEQFKHAVNLGFLGLDLFFPLHCKLQELAEELFAMLDEKRNNMPPSTFEHEVSTAHDVLFKLKECTGPNAHSKYVADPLIDDDEPIPQEKEKDSDLEQESGDKEDSSDEDSPTVAASRAASRAAARAAARAAFQRAAAMRAAVLHAAASGDKKEAKEMAKKEASEDEEKGLGRRGGGLGRRGEGIGRREGGFGRRR